MRAFIVTVVTRPADNGAMQAHEYMATAQNGAQAQLHALEQHRTDPARAAAKLVTVAVQDSTMPTSTLLQTREFSEADLEELGKAVPLYRVG